MELPKARTRERRASDGGSLLDGSPRDRPRGGTGGRRVTAVTGSSPRVEEPWCSTGGGTMRLAGRGAGRRRRRGYRRLPLGSRPEAHSISATSTHAPRPPSRRPIPTRLELRDRRAAATAARTGLPAGRPGGCRPAADRCLELAEPPVGARRHRVWAELRRRRQQERLVERPDASVWSAQTWPVRPSIASPRSSRPFERLPALRSPLARLACTRARRFDPLAVAPRPRRPRRPRAPPCSSTRSPRPRRGSRRASDGAPRQVEGRRRRHVFGAGRRRAEHARQRRDPDDSSGRADPQPAHAADARWRPFRRCYPSEVLFLPSV